MNLFLKMIGELLCAGLLFSCHSKPEEATLTLFCTTDVHGSIFQEDLKQNRSTDHSLSKVSQYLKEIRQQGETGYILLDGGDFLQGQPSNYYFNFIDTGSVNIVPQVMNYLKYDAAAVGNHDIETGHPVYDKVKQEFNFPWLAANAINQQTGKPYFQPYTILDRKGIKIAVLGMITPGIPKWLPQHLWNNIQFEDMVETAKIWVPKIQKEEKPDLIIGLFHAGFDYNYAGENRHTPRNENASLLVAQQVDGFDIIVLGHDHQEHIQEIINDAGNKVLLIDARTQALNLGKVNIHLKRENGSYHKTYTPELVEMAEISNDTVYDRHFLPELEKVKNYIDAEIGTFTTPISSREGLFGPSAFTDFIHNAQLAATGADISFSTVLQRDAQIDTGKVTIRDMFNLYRYENGLYVMQFTGAEIDRYLEYAYGLQYNTMHSGDDHLLKFKTDPSGRLVAHAKGNYTLANDFFNYSCAAGIRYTVDVSQPEGNRVEIHSLSDGHPFHTDSTYRVAINSYRGNGGGGHLTQGLGWSKAEIQSKIVEIKPKDVRFYITEYIKSQQEVRPQCRNDWKVIPAAWYQAGKERDSLLLFH